MIIKSLAVGPIQANCYIVGCPTTKNAIVIDPGDDVDQILLALAADNLSVQTIVNTHGHFDHVGGNQQLKTATGAELVIHAADAPMLTQLAQSAAAWGMTAENSPAPDRTVNDDDTIACGELEFKVIHTPGHSPGGIALYGHASLFVGDTLFAGSIGRTDLPGGNFETLKASIQQKLFILPEQTTVYPGHMGPTDIGREKRTNPFVGL